MQRSMRSWREVITPRGWESWKRQRLRKKRKKKKTPWRGAGHFKVDENENEEKVVFFPRNKMINSLCWLRWKVLWKALGSEKVKLETWHFSGPTSNTPRREHASALFPDRTPAEQNPRSLITWSRHPATKTVLKLSKPTQNGGRDVFAWAVRCIAMWYLSTHRRFNTEF